MREISRRGMLGLGVGAGAVAGLGLTGCGTGLGGKPGEAGGSGGGGKGPGKGGKPEKRVKLLGDGSTSYTGKQPNQPKKPQPLAPGETPPQFVVFSWDGAGDVGNGLFERFLKAGREHDAHMTFFLSGIYLLPESKKRTYLPPNNAPGASDIGYLTDEHIKSTLGHVRTAWLDGHEMGTHFNGHFCGGSGSVGNWTPKQWRSEIDQAKSFVKEWKTNSGWTDVEPLPFDYDKELIGGRTPCLMGQENLLPTARELGWRYDSSSPGGLQVWPKKKEGIWDLPLQSVPFPGRSFEVLSMDYNIMYNQSQNSTQAPPANYPAYRTQATGAYVAGLPARVRDEPGAAVHREPLRGVERRGVHGRRRGGPQAHRAGQGEGAGRGDTDRVLPAVRGLDGRPDAGRPGQAPDPRGGAAADGWVEGTAGGRSDRVTSPLRSSKPRRIRPPDLALRCRLTPP